MKPIDLSQLFSRRDSRALRETVPTTDGMSAADRIIMPLDLRSSIIAASRREPSRTV